MKNRKAMIEEFKQLERTIERLKRAERELDDLRRFENLFGPEIATIRRNLKSPDKVDQVEQDLAKLERKVAEHKRATQMSPDGPFAGDGQPAFPGVLSGLYSDPVYIGGGGFAYVFKARKRKDNTEVAVKVPIHLDSATGKSFLAEITCWQRLHHVNICKLLDANVLPVPYMEMELCGGSLDNVPKPMKPKDAANLILQVADGVRHAHSQGVFHRDLKPHNVLLRGGVPVVTDWGLSKLASGSTSSKVHALTPSYAAPEQISPERFGNTDHRTDIYQLGVVFYELVTGEVPFNGHGLTELLAQIVMAEPRKPSLLRPEASEVEPIIMKCLFKDKTHRYQSVAELQKDLAHCLGIGDWPA